MHLEQYKASGFSLIYFSCLNSTDYKIFGFIRHSYIQGHKKQWPVDSMINLVIG